MNTLPFSIIVPVYNDENNISRCLECILSQTYKNFECIVINDGSTDKTASICDAYSQKDSRFIVTHKNNEGISKTRQLGLDNSKGNYIIFVDSDDWIEIDFLENAYQLIKNQKYEIIFLDFFNQNSSLKEKIFNQKPSSEKSEQVTRDVLEGRQFSCLWNVIINKEYYDKFNITFSNIVNYGEDTLFILELLLNNPVIGYLEGAFYHHTFNSDSYTRKSIKNRFYERVKFLNELNKLLEKYNRTDLNDFNFFPFNDKFEALCEDIFTEREYKLIYKLSFTPYYKNQTKVLKYLLLCMAETKFYFFARIFAKLIKIKIK